MNTSSAIVYSRRHPDPVLHSQLSALPGVEIHVSTDDGKMIVTIESDNDRSAVDIYEAIERLDGVLSVAMIFQQTESHPDQELSPCK